MEDKLASREVWQHPDGTAYEMDEALNEGFNKGTGTDRLMKKDELA